MRIGEGMGLGRSVKKLWRMRAAVFSGFPPAAAIYYPSGWWLLIPTESQTDVG